MNSSVKGMFKFPTQFPAKKILSIDIGGTLAKAAFYIPKGDPLFDDACSLESLT